MSPASAKMEATTVSTRTPLTIGPDVLTSSRYLAGQ